MAGSLLGKPAEVWARLTGWLRRNQPLYLVIHHSDSGPGTTVIDIDRWHRERGWTGIAYHWVIERNPRPHPVTGRPDRDSLGRPAPVVGASTFGLNSACLAICVVGRFGVERVDSALLAEIVRVCVIACRRHMIPPDRIIGHCDARSVNPEAAASSCPGKNLYALLPEIRRRVAAELPKAL